MHDLRLEQRPQQWPVEGLHQHLDGWVMGARRDPDMESADIDMLYSPRRSAEAFIRRACHLGGAISAR